MIKIIVEAAIIDAQRTTPVLLAALPVAVAAARTVTAESLGAQAGEGAALGEQLTLARRRAIVDALRVAALIT